MAAHMVLEESGEKYRSEQVHFADAEQRSEAYLRINPLGPSTGVGPGRREAVGREHRV
jgi:hypothetical protein